MTTAANVIPGPVPDEPDAAQPGVASGAVGSEVIARGVNNSLLTALTGDIRLAAHELGQHVDRLRERTGSDHVHVVGHSLGGLIARYCVQRLGGDQAVHTLVTLGSPHAGSAAAYLLPTPLTRQLVPGSDLLEELTEPAPNCRTRFLVVWSRMDQLIIPQRNARIDHPDLMVDTLELRDVGHLSMPIHPRTVHWVATSLARLDHTHPAVLADARPGRLSRTSRLDAHPAS